MPLEEHGCAGINVLGRTLQVYKDSALLKLLNSSTESL